MHPTPPLSGSHLRTYTAIFQPPGSHRLGWDNIHSLLRRLGKVKMEPNGKRKVTRNGQVMIMPLPFNQKVSEPNEILALRQFLERSDQAVTTEVGRETHWLVVIDHHEARIYRSVAPGAVPQQIRPHVAENFFQPGQAAKGVAREPGQPEPGSFFEPVAGVLNGAGEILVFGCGADKSSEMGRFVTWLKATRPAVAGRIIGTHIVDEPQLSEGQLLAKARKIYAHDRGV